MKSPHSMRCKHFKKKIEMKSTSTGENETLQKTKRYKNIVSYQVMDVCFIFHVIEKVGLVTRWRSGKRFEEGATMVTCRSNIL